MSSLPAILTEDCMDLDCPEATNSASSVSDPSVDTTEVVPSRTIPSQKHVSTPTQQSSFMTVEERALWSALAKSRQYSDIMEAGAWVTDDPDCPEIIEGLFTNKELSARDTLGDRASGLSEVAVAMHESEINHTCPSDSSKDASLVLSIEKPTECPSPSSESGLVSGYTSIDEASTPLPHSGDTTALVKLALAVFEFWPAGVSAYSVHAPTSHPSGYNEGGTPTESSFRKPGASKQGAAAGNTNSQPEKESTFNQGSKLSRSIKRKAARGDPVPQHRCPVEAGRNDESCVGITNFDDIPRHLKNRHTDSYESVPYHGKTLAQHFKDLKTRLKYNTDEACETFAVTLFTIMYPNKLIPYLRFDLLPSGIRRPHDPPTAPALNLFPASLPPTPITRDSNLADEQSVRTPRPMSACSSHAVTEVGLEISDQHEFQSRKRNAAPNFAAEMKANPLFAIRVRRIADELNTHERNAQLQRAHIKYQLGSKRKELEADTSASSSGSDQPAKRACYSKSHSEAVSKLRIIDTSLKQSYDEAEQKMQDLYDGWSGGQSSSPSIKTSLQKQDLINPVPQPVIASADGPDGLGSSEYVALPDLNFDYQDFLNEDYDGVVANMLS